MTQETIPYLHDSCMVGGVTGGAVVVNGVIVTIDALLAADATLRKQYDDAKAAAPGWRPPSWWFDSRLENAERPSHFAGYLTPQMIKDRLFGWTALDADVKLSCNLIVPNPHFSGEDDPETIEVPVEFPAALFKGIVRDDKLRDLYNEWWATGKVDQAALNATVLGMHSDEYTAHQLAKTFIDDTANIVGTDAKKIGITSALLLRGGRVASMEISIPEEMHNDASGMNYRPNLVVSTSFNGTLPTSWTRTITATVCDNTLQYALSQAGNQGKYKVRHTKNSLVHIRDAVQALGLLHEQAETFDEVLKSWSETPVTEGQFNEWLNRMLPVPDVKTEVILSVQGEKIGEKTKTNSQNLVLNKRDKIETLWTSDERVSPWRGTLLGIHQAWNTFNQHESMVKGVASFGGNKLQARVESNQFKVLKGEFEKSDADAMSAINLILADAESAEKTTIPLGSNGKGGTAVMDPPAVVTATLTKAGTAKVKAAAKKTTAPKVAAPAPLPSGDDNDSVQF